MAEEGRRDYHLPLVPSCISVRRYRVDENGFGHERVSDRVRSLELDLLVNKILHLKWASKLLDRALRHVDIQLGPGSGADQHVGVFDVEAQRKCLRRAADTHELRLKIAFVLIDRFCGPFHREFLVEEVGGTKATERLLVFHVRIDGELRAFECDRYRGEGLRTDSASCGCGKVIGGCGYDRGYGRAGRDVRARYSHADLKIRLRVDAARGDVRSASRRAGRRERALEAAVVERELCREVLRDEAVLAR